MNDPPTQEPAKTTINLKKTEEEKRFADLHGFDQRASLTIARWVLIIFGGVYLLGFAGMFILFFQTDASFEKGADLVKFMVQSLLPLVTLAVGYYLGDKGRQQNTGRRR